MTYFGILTAFILPPLLVLAILVPRDIWAWITHRREPVNWRPYIIIGAHVLLALAYTTPWDNYLVATGVWWYNPEMVTGITLGYVPIEEYTFFVVQTLLSGLWTVALFRRIAPMLPLRERPGLRHWASLFSLAMVIGFTALWLSGWKPGTYLSLILSWAFVPVLVQVWFGADILLHAWRVILPAVWAPTLYLWLVDYLAIGSGTWVIDPLQTTGVKVGVLPMEEMVFFLMTNVIIGFGIILMLSPDSQVRAAALLQTARLRWTKGSERTPGRG